MSSDVVLDRHELDVLSCLGKGEVPSQRAIAAEIGISVGLVNAIIKRLATTGYVKVKKLNQRQLQYMLTPKGFAQVFLRSYRYIVSTIEQYLSLEVRLVKLVKELHGEGYDVFIISGGGPVKQLVRSAFRNALCDLPVVLKERPAEGDNFVVLSVDGSKPFAGAPSVDLLKELGR